jgi:hypothetical protein
MIVISGSPQEELAPIIWCMIPKKISGAVRMTARQLLVFESFEWMSELV